jgi:hypothetical protein
MWIICCGMRRGGATLQYQLVRDLVVARCGGTAHPHFVKGADDFQKLQSSYAEEAGPVVFQCHAFIEEAVKLAEQGKAKVFYVYRDVREVVVFMMKRDGMSFQTLARRGFLELLLSEYSGWTSAPGAFVSKYDRMMGNPASEIARIAAHLELNVPIDDAVRMAEKFESERRKERLQRLRTLPESAGTGDVGRGGAAQTNESRIPAGGSVPRRIELNNKQTAYVESVAGSWLEDRGYTLNSPALRRRALKLWRAISRAGGLRRMGRGSWPSESDSSAS